MIRNKRINITKQLFIGHFSPLNTSRETNHHKRKLLERQNAQKEKLYFVFRLHFIRKRKEKRNMGILERIGEIEKEIARTQKNKGTNLIIMSVD